MSHNIPKDMAEARSLLIAGKLEMQRPHGDWVPVRPRKSYRNGFNGSSPVWMENEVESSITIGLAKLGFPGVRAAQ